MMRSLFSAVSGLQNHQVRMDVIGNNIANVNTTGFKRSRVNFQDMLSQTLSGAARPTENKGGVNPKQIGLGMVIASIDTIHTQGSLQTTGVNTDMAISGNGFFVLKEGDRTYYTRAGAFGLDKDGLLVNPSTGLKVQGWESTLIGGQYMIRSAENPGDISIPLYQKDPASATQNVDFKCNLFSEMPVVPTLTGLTEQDRLKNTWASSINIFDSKGNPLEARFTFYKTGVNQWNVRSEVFQDDPNNPGQKIQIPAANYNINVNQAGGGGNAAQNGQNEFVLNFDNLGRLISVTDQAGDRLNAGNLNATLNLTVPGTTPGLPGENIAMQLNLGQSGMVRTENGVGITQFSSAFSTKPFRQDGYGMGYLEGIKIDDTGTVTGVFSNGNNRVLAQVALANFTNPGGLEKSGETNYVLSNNSGEPDIGTAGSTGKGKIMAGTLEMSNVDLADQFVDMIVTQRGFQANSRTIQTADQMLQELLSLKR
jgi:flagellar hook protein FlgE